MIDSPFPVNPAGFVIHSAVHEARPDVQCVLHTHTRAGVAVSAQKCGILPISQQSTFVLASLAYHDYEGVAFREEEKPRLQADLGRPVSGARNHACWWRREHRRRFLQIPPSRTPAYQWMPAGGELVQVNPRSSVVGRVLAADRRLGGALRCRHDPQVDRIDALQGLKSLGGSISRAYKRAFFAG